MTTISPAYHSDAAKFIGARVSRSTNQSIPNETETAIQWNIDEYDTDGLHDVSVNNTRLVATIDGYYRIGASINWATGATGQRWLRYRVNGVGLVRVDKIDAAAGVTEHNFSTELFLNATDYIEVVVRHDFGALLNVREASFATISLAGT